MRLFLLFSLILLNLTKFYSQNNSYSIKAIFDPSERKIKIDQTISFYNNEEFEIDYLILNDWAKTQLGFEFKKNILELPYLLGWRMIDKLKFYPLKYINSIANRLTK